MPFDRNDLLQQAGASEGDLISLSSFSSPAKSQQTSSTSFTILGNGNTNRVIIGLDNLPFNAYSVAIVGRIRCDTAGETFTIRTKNASKLAGSPPQLQVTGSNAKNAVSSTTELTTTSGIYSTAFEGALSSGTATGTQHLIGLVLFGRL